MGAVPGRISRGRDPRWLPRARQRAAARSAHPSIPRSHDLEAGPFRRFNFVVGGAATGKTAFLQPVRLIKAHRPGARLLLTGELALAATTGWGTMAAGRLFDRDAEWTGAVVDGDYDGGYCTRVVGAFEGAGYWPRLAELIAATDGQLFAALPQRAMVDALEPAAPQDQSTVLEVDATGRGPARRPNGREPRPRRRGDHPGLTSVGNARPRRANCQRGRIEPRRAVRGRSYRVSERTAVAAVREEAFKHESLKVVKIYRPG